jgi:uncharacterized membrane protein (DUF4010 family)
MAALGGLYSSTATTVVLARQASQSEYMAKHAQAGITLATGIMYLRLLAIVTVFNWTLGIRLALPMCGLSALAILISAIQYRSLKSLPKEQVSFQGTRNPLELGAAAVFAVLFVLTSFLSNFVAGRFGASGIYWLAAFIGVTDIDPFVLNLAQGGASELPEKAITASILIAASSNNLLKAAYAAGFAGGRATGPSAAVLIGLALAGVAIAIAVIAW